MKRLFIFALLGLAAAVAACSTDGVEGEHKANEPPTVWLSAGPPEGSTGTYRIQMFWGGWDPDGEIKGYEYLVSNNKGTFQPSDTVGVPWRPVVGNDSTFTFSADIPVDSVHADQTKQVDVFMRSHTFFIRAIDQEGLRSRQPAYRSFTSRTLSPEVHIQRPPVIKLNPASVPQISTFRWKAIDWVDDKTVSQDPDSVQYALAPVPVSDGANYDPTIDKLRKGLLDQYWRPWVWYKAPQDSGKFWTTPVIERGNYVFAIRAKDEAGAITPVLDTNPDYGNVRRLRVGPLTSGPLMSVNNDYVGLVRTASCSTPTTILDSPAGVPLEFKIRASADSYGGTIAGYRYGWDIPDLDDPEQWEIDITPFLNVATVPARSFFFGTHTLTMEVQDNSGYCSRIEVKVNIVQFTMERNVLVIDDDVADDLSSSGWSNGGIIPSDAETDAFWVDMVSGVQGFDSEIDMVNTRSHVLPLTLLARYKSIIWNVRADIAMRSYPLLYDYIAHRVKNPPENAISTGKVVPDVLALAMAAGGHIMVCGRTPLSCVVNRALWRGSTKYPLIFLYELEGKQDGTPDVNNPVGDLSFAYRELCLETLDYSNFATIQLLRGNKQYCRIDLVRPHGPIATSPRDDAMREALPLDPNFPTLSLRPEAAGPGRWFEPSHLGIDAEVYNPLYFRKSSGKPGSCVYVPTAPRSCFQPIYGLGCIDTQELTYNQPVAFWTSAFADRVADAPGAVGARSVVFGFPPVYFNPSEFHPAMDYILFNEWKLPRSNNVRAASAP